MAGTVIEVSAPGRSRKEYRVFDGPEVTVGRGLDNDLIIADPFVSRRHLRIRKEEGGWLVEDLGSLNGILPGKGSEPARKVLCRSGDEILMGKTRLCLFSPEHPVGPARALPRDGPLRRFLGSPLGVALSLGAMAAALTMEEYLGSWEQETLFKHAVPAVALLVIVVLWSSLWALAGRLIAHRPSLLLHLSASSLFVAALPFCGTFAGYAGYVSGSLVVENSCFALLTALLLTLLLTHLLGITTQAARRKRVLFSGGVSLLLILLSVFFGYAMKEELEAGPRYYARLKPPLLLSPAAVEPDLFLAGSERIFSVQPRRLR
jgi:hypothetical protein